MSDPKKRQLYDQYGKEGANAADQMGENGGGFPGHGFHGGFPGGGGGGAHHMSSDEARAFFADAFGGSDPFGSMFGSVGSGPGVSFRSSRGVGGGPDPIQMMFAQQMGGMGGMPRSSLRREVKRYDAIPRGTVVSLKELKNKSDLNGEHGQIQQFIPESGRYVVVLEDSEETLSVKANNILQHAQALLQDIQSQPELNGRKGTIITWCPNKQRYNIYLKDMRKVVSLRPNNVILDSGTVAQITGLQSKPELNGKWGTINKWIRETNRYDVQLSAQQVIRVKVENMRV